MITKSITKSLTSQKFDVKISCMGALDNKQQIDYNEILRTKYNVKDAEITFTTPSNEELARIEAESDEEIVSVRTDIAKISNRLDSLNNYQEEVVDKIEEEKSWF